MDLIRWLLATFSTPPPGAGGCPMWLVVAYHVANLIITICYLAIPGIVLYYWRYRRDGIDPLKLWMVLAFLPFQSLSRLSRIDGIALPVIAALDVIAALVTVNSVVWLRPKILHLLDLPSHDEMHRINDDLQAKVFEIRLLHEAERAKNALLLAEIEKVRRAPLEQSWLLARHKALDRIVEVINEGR